MRVSTSGQKDDSQAHAINRYCEAHGLSDVRTYSDAATGAHLGRPAFGRLQRDIFAGRVHTVIVWKLDRLARSLRDGINALADWCERGVRIIAVSQQLDFNGVTGKLIAAVLLAVAEMERAAIIERTVAGLDAARAKGVTLGRPKGSRSKWSLAKRKVDPVLAVSLRAQGVKVRDIAAKFGCSRQAIQTVLREAAESNE
jgi:DNA invertase Pin-like site-specific DNA recombinase